MIAAQLVNANATQITWAIHATSVHPASMAILPVHVSYFEDVTNFPGCREQESTFLFQLLVFVSFLKQCEKSRQVSQENKQWNLEYEKHLRMKKTPFID